RRTSCLKRFCRNYSTHATTTGSNEPCYGGLHGMTTQAVSPACAQAEGRDSWVPMIVIAMGQALMSFNVNALPISIGGIVASFDTPPTAVGTAIITYSLFIAGFVMLC